MASPGRVAQHEPDVVTVVVESLLRTCWWWRAELAATGLVVATGWWLDIRLGRTVSAVITSSSVCALVLLPWPGRLITRLLASERGRRRWHRAIRQVALPALRDRPTEVVRSRSVPAGDLLTVVVPYGSAVTDLEAAADVLAAALHARDVRVTRDRANARQAQVLVLRADPLGDPLPLAWPWLDRDRVSLWEPVPVGVDETGDVVTLCLPERNLLLGGEPGGGKSVALSVVIAAAALDPDVHVWLLDGKRVELAAWNSLARAAVGPDIDDAIAVLRDLQAEMDDRYEQLLATGRRKLTADAGLPLQLLACDELSFYLHTGNRKISSEFATRLRDLVARGRAAGVIVATATQKPSTDVVPSSLRDLFAFRWAMRCTTPQASDTILGQGWASQGCDAADVELTHKGVGWLLAEGALPTRCKAFNLDDQQIAAVAGRAKRLRATEGGW
jgi:hypothetical protein